MRRSAANTSISSPLPDQNKGRRDGQPRFAGADLFLGGLIPLDLAQACVETRHHISDTKKLNRDRQMSAGVELDQITVRFGEFTAVDSATLDIRGGEFFSFLGPSGCGKTTILRTVSGFLDPSEGAVRIGGKDMRGIGPNRRPTALIFQNLALVPADDGGGEHHLWPARARRRPGDPEAQGRRAAAADRAAGPGQQADERAVRRAEAAGGDRARLVRAAAGAAARRAAVGPGPEAAPAHAQRAAHHPAHGRHHLHLHHP